MGDFPLGVRFPFSFGRYLVHDRLGGGGMATVYRATFSAEGGFEKEVALKVIRGELAEDPQFIRMFLDEAKLSGALSHPNIVQTFDFGQVDGTYFLAMELIRGRTLSAILAAFQEKGVRLGTTASLFVARDLSRALAYAHRLQGGDGSVLGIVHRDVSPQNVLISKEGDVKLVDFGIAKAALRSQITQPGRVRGKCSYMAPEQARGLEVDARADVFALGAVLWECLVGRRLFEGPSDAAVLLQVIEKEIPPPSTFVPGIDPEVDEVVLRLLSRDPSRRPESSQVHRELAGLAFRLARSPEDLDLRHLQQRLATASAVVSQPEIDLTAWRPTGEESAERFPWAVDPSARTEVPQAHGGAATAPRGNAGRAPEREPVGAGAPRQDDNPATVAFEPSFETGAGPVDDDKATAAFDPSGETLVLQSGEAGAAMEDPSLATARFDPSGETVVMQSGETATRTHGSGESTGGGRHGKALIPVAIASGVGALVGIVAILSWNPWAGEAQAPPPAEEAVAEEAVAEEFVAYGPPILPEEPPAAAPQTAAPKLAPRREAPAPRRAAAPKPTPSGQVVLSTRLPGAAVSVGRGPRQSLLPHAPLSLSVEEGRRRIAFYHLEGERSCAVEVRIEGGEKVALLFDQEGVGRLDGLTLQRLPCL